MSDTKVSFLSNTVYDALKWVALVALPATGALYFTLAGVWDLPKAEEIVGTIVAVDTFLGILLGVAKKKYDHSDDRYDGSLNVDQVDNRLIHSLDIQIDPVDLAKKDSILLKVNQVEPE